MPPALNTDSDEFAVSEKDSNYVKSLKSTGANLREHIEKREARVKTLKGDEAAGHQQTLASERAALDSIRKEIKDAAK